jgi:hypothetical protein
MPAVTLAGADGTESRSRPSYRARRGRTYRSLFLQVINRSLAAPSP